MDIVEQTQRLLKFRYLLNDTNNRTAIIEKALKKKGGQQEKSQGQKGEKNEKKKQVAPTTASKVPEEKKEIIEENQDDQQQIRPEVDPYSTQIVDYDQLIVEFGTKKIDESLIERIERITGKPAHHFIQRGIFFSHRDLDLVLQAQEKGKPFYLYTGRGPSSQSMHLGHLMPFIFTKWLQDTFDVPLVIELTDDQKFFHQKSDSHVELQQYTKWGIENAKDIIACGFDMNKTFIFLDTDYVGNMYTNVAKIQRAVTFNQLKGIFGVTMNDNCGKVAYPAIQAAPSFCSSFKHIFGKRQDVFCLIPCGIDQDPYFRMTRDVAVKLGLLKPAVIHSIFFPSLLGPDVQMSSSVPNSAIFLTDTPQNIKTKIQGSVSGGGATKEEQEQFGAQLEVDIPYQYLQFFSQDDQKVQVIGEKYGSGQMLSGEVQQEITQVLTKIVTQHQERRKKVTDQVVRKYMEVRPLSFAGNQI